MPEIAGMLLSVDCLCVFAVLQGRRKVKVTTVRNGERTHSGYWRWFCHNTGAHSL